MCFVELFQGDCIIEKRHPHITTIHNLRPGFEVILAYGVFVRRGSNNAEGRIPV